MAFILSLDQGTTSSRAILFDETGKIVGSAQREFEQLFPRPGWVEHRPGDIWASQAEVAKEALSKAGIAASELAAVGITNQRETTLVWDRKTGEPVYNAIVWQDRRTAGYIDTLKAEGLEELIGEKTGLVLDAYFSASKLVWILDHVEGARARAERGELAFGTVDTWLLYKLTGGEVFMTDVSNASRTMMFNIRTLTWDDEILDILNVPRAMLPTIKSSSEVYGETAAEVLGARVSVAGVAGDQQAATFGQACFREGQGKNTYGTGAFMVLNTGEEPVPSSNKLLTTVAWGLDDAVTYALEGSIFVAGAAVQWLRDGLGIIRTSSEVEALAGSVPDNGGVYLVPAFTGLGAPHWDPYARGALLGLTRGSTAGNIARAALEGIAYQVHDVIRAMERDGVPLKELRVDGGASTNDLLMQFQADLLGVPVVRPAIIETTALGAAYLAGLAVGYWQNKEDIAAQWSEGKRFEPQMKRGARDTLLEGWQKALSRSKDWATE